MPALGLGFESEAVLVYYSAVVPALDLFSIPKQGYYEDFKNKDIFCTFKIKIKSQNLDHRCINEQ